jgi:hypothetical protein
MITECPTSHNRSAYASLPLAAWHPQWLSRSVALIPTQPKVPALPFGNRLRKDALRESHNRQEQNEALTKAVLDFTEGSGIIKTCNLPGENPMG